MCLSTGTTSKCHFSPGLPSGSPKIETFVVPKLWTFIYFSNQICFQIKLSNFKSGLNEQFEGTLSIYASRPFQWCPRGPIWCFFAFPTKVPNIHNSCTNATPKVGVHLGVIGLHPLHSPAFVRVCLTFNHTLGLMALALHT
jgi:hypothetical protein